MEFVLSHLKVIGLAIAGVVVLALVIKNFQKIKGFVLEVKIELSKVAWSTRQEILNSTFVVIGITLILAVFIGLIDIALSKVLSLALK